MKIVKIISFCFILFSVWPVHAVSKTVSMPMSIDYKLLQALIISTAFTDSDNSAVVVDEDDGCVKITISEPTYKEERSFVRFETRVHVRAGLHMFGRCILPVEWEGYLAIFQTPVIEAGNWMLSFKAEDSILYDLNHKPAKLAGIVWDLVKNHVYDYLNGITLNLVPPVSKLKSFLFPLFPDKEYSRVKKMMDGMRPGKTRVDSDAIRIDIIADVFEVYEKEKEVVTERVSGEEREKFIVAWENWDEFLVNMILSLANKPLTDEQRASLLDVLLETRYRFITELGKSDVGKDFVREQFISAWGRLSPVFRDCLTVGSSESLLDYLAFFTASDALRALDKIGPTLGIEISRNGLIRLARLLAEGEPIAFSYSPNENKTLRKTLGLSLPLMLPGRNRPELNIREGNVGRHGVDVPPKSVLSYIFSPSRAMADEAGVKPDELRQWLLSLNNVETCLKRTKKLLENMAERTLETSKIGEKYHDLYRLIVFSVGWQESCFRQFIKKKGKIICLRSYDNSSVGIMQINERVWRGFYNPEHLQGDISYNVMAGCEILDLYFYRYLLRKIKKLGLKGLNDDTMAGILYAMYNGGPGQFSKYLQRKKKGTYYLSDRLFMEKHTWIKKGEWQNIKKCL